MKVAVVEENVVKGHGRHEALVNLLIEVPNQLQVLQPVPLRVNVGTRAVR
jgi:hypothetical protein